MNKKIELLVYCEKRNRIERLIQDKYVNDESYSLRLFSNINQVEQTLSNLDSANHIIVICPIDQLEEDRLEKLVNYFEGIRLPLVILNQTDKKYLSKDSFFVLEEKSFNLDKFDAVLNAASKCLSNQKRIIYEKENPSSSEFVFFKTGDRLVKTLKKEIMVIRAEGNYCDFLTVDKKFSVKVPLSLIEKKWSNYGFVRIHRNYIVNLSEVSEIRLKSNQILIKHYELPIGKKYRKLFLDGINKASFDR